MGKDEGVRALEADYVRMFLGRMAGGQFALFVRQVGAIKTEGRMFRAGFAGQADVWGVHLPTGKHVEIEVKRHTKLSSPQEHWRDWCRKRHIPWILLEADKRETMPETVGRWERELKVFHEVIQYDQDANETGRWPDP